MNRGIPLVRLTRFLQPNKTNYENSEIIKHTRLINYIIAKIANRSFSRTRFHTFFAATTTQTNTSFSRTRFHTFFAAATTQTNTSNDDLDFWQFGRRRRIFRSQPCRGKRRFSIPSVRGKRCFSVPWKEDAVICKKGSKGSCRNQSGIVCKKATRSSRESRRRLYESSCFF